jgi:hypothetical protein
MDNKILEKSEFDKVTGEIYKITNAITNKYYIGQARSHRLNHGKYRPFGHIGRFKDHISETYSNKTNTCKYLNSSIAKYGEQHFTCELLIRCGLNELDDYERHYIIECKSKYPNGYNLTDGGQQRGSKKGSKIHIGTIPERGHNEVTSVGIGRFSGEATQELRSENDIIPYDTLTPEKSSSKVRNRPRSEETKQKISKGIKVALNTENHLNKMMKLVQNQHLEKKFEILRDVELDQDNLDQYISIKTNNKNNTKYIQIAFDRKRRISFVGKHESIEQTKDRALQFMRELINRGNTTKLRETTLESLLPLPDGNILEELG